MISEIYLGRRGRVAGAFPVATEQLAVKVAPPLRTDCSGVSLLLQHSGGFGSLAAESERVKRALPREACEALGQLLVLCQLALGAELLKRLLERGLGAAKLGDPRRDQVRLDPLLQGLNPGLSRGPCGPGSYLSIPRAGPLGRGEP